MFFMPGGIGISWFYFYYCLLQIICRNWIEKNEKNRYGKIWFILGLIANIGVLGVFKYYNFFIDSFIDLFSLMGYDLPRSSTKIILPLELVFMCFYL